MEKLVTVIVPVYNVEKFLNRCIISIINQTYKNLEIILIDDGSIDKSGKICDDWKEKDARIKVFHKENGGASSARNVGLENATGKWISFIDSDDYIDENFIEELRKSAIKNDADIAAGGYRRITFYNEELKHCKEDYVANSEEIIRRLLKRDDISFAMCDKIFKRELFNEIKFPDGKMNEDIGTLYRVFDKANKIVHISKAGYYYMQRNGSVEHTNFTIKNLAGVEFTEDIVELMEKKYPKLVELAEALFVGTINNCTVLCYRNDLREEHEKLKEKLKTYIPRILKNSEIGLTRKIKSILIGYCGFSRIFNR